MGQVGNLDLGLDAALVTGQGHADQTSDTIAVLLTDDGVGFLGWPHVPGVVAQGPHRILVVQQARGDGLGLPAGVVVPMGLVPVPVTVGIVQVEHRRTGPARVQRRGRAGTEQRRVRDRAGARIDVGDHHPGVVPGHVRMVPLDPRQLGAVG